MQYRPFGKQGWQASALGFGCMRLPTIDGKSGNINQEEAIRMIHYAIDQGVNYFDTAFGYHERQSEIVVGKALSGGWRDKVNLVTKLPMWLVEAQDDYDRFLEEQLRKLQTDHLDVYLFHGLNRDAWHKVQRLNLLEKAERAVADGRIGAVGFSFHDNVDAFKEIIDGYDKWAMAQIQYNYMDVENQAGTEGLRYAGERKIAVVVMEPLLGGKLARTIPSVGPLWADYAVENPETAGRNPAEWALQWLWDQPEVTVALSGMSTFEQVEQNIASANRSLVGQMTAADLALIATVRDAINQRSPIPCTACEYCLPCPNGVAIPRNFDVYNGGAMYDDPAGSRFAYKRWIGDSEKAAVCIACQECEPKCPQKIEISRWMPVVEEVLGLGRDYVMKL